MPRRRSKKKKNRGIKKRRSSKCQKDSVIRRIGDLESLASAIKRGEIRRIVWLSGAGISVSAGIPDFRTKGTGLYSRLEKYELPRPECMFDIEYFKKRPEAFFDLAKELLPGEHVPTRTHVFLKLLSDKGLLQRTYTQNIDGLERLAGVPEHKIVEAHGSFAKSYCVNCKAQYDNSAMRSAILNNKIPHCKKCDGLAKPGIVFFGESLPKRFHKMHRSDMKTCDLLIVAGTSLRVQPFSELPRIVKHVPRVLINRERVGEGGYNGFDFDSKSSQDVLALGNSDDIVSKLADLLGWSEELETRCSSLYPFRRERKPSFVEKVVDSFDNVVDSLERGMKALKVF